MQDDAEESALHLPSALAGRAGADCEHQRRLEMIHILVGEPPFRNARPVAWLVLLVVSRSINGEQQACLVLFYVLM